MIPTFTDRVNILYEQETKDQRKVFKSLAQLVTKIFVLTFGNYLFVK